MSSVEIIAVFGVALISALLGVLVVAMIDVLITRVLGRKR